jgi:type I restriction enzyme, S subunit
MSKVPDGWKTVCVRDVIIPFETVDPLRTPNTSFTYVDIGSIDNQTQSIRDPKIILGKEAPSRARRRIHAGDVLFSTVRTYLKNIAVVPKELDGAVTSTGIAVLRPSKDIDSRFLFNWTRSPEFLSRIGKAMDGTMYPAVTDRDVLDQAVPLPPIAEQRRIVATLDSLLNRSNIAGEELAHIPRLVERYKQSVLASAFRGELTARWRAKTSTKSKATLADDLAAARSATFRKAGTKEKPALSAAWTPNVDLPETWEIVSVDQLTTLVQYGTSAKTSDSLSKGVPVLRMGNILGGQLDYGNLKYLPASHGEFPELFLRDGDILFNRTNSAELVGKTAVYTDVGHRTSFASYLIRLRVVGYLPGLLSAYINSAIGREWVRSVVNQQVGQANVNGTKLRELGVPLMPPEEQKDLWSRINSAFTRIDELFKEATRARELLDRLDQATLTKAFRGELLK